LVLRPKDVIGSPEKCILEMGYGDTIWGRSAGGVTPSGWSCEHGYLQMQGSKCLNPSDVRGAAWYYANTKSEACPNGFNQEETIKAIWQSVPDK
jgi:hypothetical protein